VQVFLAYSFLKLVQYVAGRYDYSVLRDTGDYGQLNQDNQPGKINYRTWAIQMIAWCIITVAARVSCGSLVIGGHKLFVHIAELVTKPFDGQPKLMLACVMIACPVGMNTLQFWIQDTFLKKDPEDVSGHSAVAPYDAPVYDLESDLTERLTLDNSPVLRASTISEKSDRGL